MSRRKRRRRPCRFCSDMGADAPAATHRLVYRYPEDEPDSIFGASGPRTFRLKVCRWHARGWASDAVTVTAYRLKGGRR